MSSPNLYLIFVVTSVLSFHLWNLRSQEITCNPDDLKALNGFSSCLKPHVLGWNNSSVSDCCTWTGVTCDNSLSKRVVALELALDQLRILNLFHNYICGTLPTELFRLKNLEVLDVSDNGFIGIIPEEHLSGICFYGEVPQGVGNCTSLQYLWLNGNNFRSLTKGIFRLLQDLRVLYLQNNIFSGPLNHGIGCLSSLVELDISSNSFSGALPDVFGSLGKLEKFSASSNNFNGTLRVSLFNSPLIMSLDLHNNSLNYPEEEIPSDPGFRFGSLRVLSIAYCELKGSIPPWLLGCNELQFLDMSRKHLAGTNSSWFNEFKYLFYVDLSNNSFTDGATFRYNNIWSFPPTLDLSYNMITGPVWPSFGDSRRLHVLNLNENRLTGSIPESLSGLKSLEVLDLSHNRLSGNTPISLAELSFLSKFNVAYNELQGEITMGGQFMTFPYSSFEGNSGLCGGTYVPYPVQHGTIDESTGDDRMTVLGPQFGYGVATGFVLTVTVCFMSGWVLPSKRHNI
ncbi:phytosulfokine receptor 1-like [Hibiscus syriacus]|uniref:phytosulfokine receptor 1-like n=1 Tax=Hibiscus syriacus TaxID=106335 RepID=UPI0019215B95|nr:phytosulfokine receptor 1-like [Hibiscus syriacus]